MLLSATYTGHIFKFDILVTGVDTQDHYRALHETFQCLGEAGLTRKRSKCEFKKS